MLIPGRLDPGDVIGIDSGQVNTSDLRTDRAGAVDFKLGECFCGHMQLLLGLKRFFLERESSVQTRLQSQ